MDAIFKRGKKANSPWYCDIWHWGIRVRECLGCYGDKGGAYKELVKLLNSVEKGEYQKGNRKFEAVAAGYEPKTNVVRKLSLIKTHLMPILKGRKMWSLKVDEFLENKTHEMSQSSLAQLMSVMRELGWEFEGMSSVKPSKRTGIAQRISLDQFYDFFEDKCPKRYRAFCEVAFFSTLRLVDVLSLTKANVDFSKDENGDYVGGIRVVPRKTRKKNPSATYCPMTKKLHEAFLSIGIRPFGDSDLWFPGIKAVNVSQSVKRAFKEVGMPWASFQQLRRFGATYLYRNGMPIAVVSKLLHHKSLRQTETYLEIVEEELVKGMALFDEFPERPAQNRRSFGAK